MGVGYDVRHVQARRVAEALEGGLEGGGRGAREAGADGADGRSGGVAGVWEGAAVCYEAGHGGVVGGGFSAGVLGGCGGGGGSLICAGDEGGRGLAAGGLLVLGLRWRDRITSTLRIVSIIVIGVGPQ